MLYLDASALVKRYVREEGTKELMRAMEENEVWATSRIGYVETARVIGRKGADAALESLQDDWDAFDVFEVDALIADEAVRLALGTGLRTLDAIHLATAIALPGRNLKFATWDARLHRVAEDQGLTLLPDSLPS
jgi:predicted nucleic acid-binding protein